jgi:hypothetical protein
VILADGTVVELTNICDDPAAGYTPDLDALIPLLPTMSSTWHSHPDASAQLSGEDWETFSSWPDHTHAIVGNDGVRWYAVKGGGVVNAA